MRHLILSLTCCLCLALSSTSSMAGPHQDNFLLGGTLKGLRNYTKLDIEITIHGSMNKLIEKENLDIQLRIFESTAELRTSESKKRLSGIFTSTLEYFEFEKTHQPRLGVQFRGAPLKQKLLVVARKGSQAQSLLDFRGKKLTLADEQDLEKLYLNTLLLRQKQAESEQYFSEITKPKNTNVALMDVFFKRSDITVVRESQFATAVELNPQLGKKLMVLNQSPAYISVVVSSREDSAFSVDKLTDVMSRLHKTNAGKRLLRMMQVDAVTEISADALADVKALMQEYQQLRKHR